MLHELLGIPLTEKRVVSILGGGGKTTLMYALSRESSKAGKTTLFTTTNIFVPDEPDITLLDPFSADKAQECWRNHRIVSAGQPLSAVGKLGPPEDSVKSWLLDNADGIYIEADGSKRLPLKYPASWEPVILDETTHSIAVAGLSALGQTVETVVHRFALAADNAKYCENVVTPEGMAQLMWAGYGRFDPVFLLNQADTPALETQGQLVAERLISFGARRVVILSLKKEASESRLSLPNE